jgi:hypothetical protein
VSCRGQTPDQTSSTPAAGELAPPNDKFPSSVLPGTFHFGFITGLSNKDVRLRFDDVEGMTVPMVCDAVVRQMLAITNAEYGAASDFTSIAKVIEAWARVQDAREALRLVSSCASVTACLQTRAVPCRGIAHR